MTTETPADPGLSAEDARRAARNIGVLMAASILSKGLLFGWQIVLAPWLGSTDYGIYNTIIALFALGAAIANFGIGPISIREVASKPELAGKYAATMLFTQTGLALVGYIFVLVSGALAGYSNVILAYTAIAGISLIVDIFGSISNDLLIAQERMVITSAVEIGQIVLRVGLAGAALALGYGLLGLYATTIFVGLVRAAVLWIAQVRGGVRPEWPLERDILRPLLVNAAPLAAAAFLAMAYQHADKLMTTAIIGVDSTGYLGPAFLINFGISELIGVTIMTAMFPLLSRAYTLHDSETFGWLVETLARFMLIVGLPLALMLSIFSHDVIAFIYRSGEYAPTGGILRILIWYTLLNLLSSVLTRGLLVQNRQRRTLILRVFSLVLNISLNTFLLIRTQDVRGAAVASVFAESLMLTGLALSFRASGFKWGDVLRGMARVLVVGAVAALVMLLVGQIHWMLGMASGGLVYAAGIIWGGVLAAADWDLLYRLLAALPGGGFIRRYWKRDVAVRW